MTVSVSKKAKAEGATAPVAAGKFEVMLGNDCKRYVILNPDSSTTVYEEDVVYKVNEAKRAALFELVDDNGTPYFYNAEEVKRQRMARMKKARTRERIEAGLDPVKEDGSETDTGAVRLQDADGRAVGTVEV